MQAAFLKKLGCDRVVNYKKESLGKVLKEEYPDGCAMHCLHNMPTENASPFCVMCLLTTCHDTPPQA